MFPVSTTKPIGFSGVSNKRQDDGKCPELWWWGWQTYRHLRADCLDNVESSTSHNPIYFRPLTGIDLGMHIYRDERWQQPSTSKRTENLEKCFPQNNMVNSYFYCDVLSRLRENVHWKKPGTTSSSFNTLIPPPTRPWKIIATWLSFRAPRKPKSEYPVSLHLRNLPLGMPDQLSLAATISATCSTSYLQSKPLLVRSDCESVVVSGILLLDNPSSSAAPCPLRIAIALLRAVRKK
jgi:hypothetical protein